MEYKNKTSLNIGTLWRSANIFGASFIFAIGIIKKQGKRYMNPKDTFPYIL